MNKFGGDKSIDCGGSYTTMERCNESLNTKIYSVTLKNKKDNYICKNKDKNKKIFNIYTTDINYCTLLEKLPKIRN